MQQGTSPVSKTSVRRPHLACFSSDRPEPAKRYTPTPIRGRPVDLVAARQPVVDADDEEAVGPASDATVRGRRLMPLLNGTKAASGRRAGGYSVRTRVLAAGDTAVYIDALTRHWPLDDVPFDEIRPDLKEI